MRPISTFIGSIVTTESGSGSWLSAASGRNSDISNPVEAGKGFFFIRVSNVSRGFDVQFEKSERLLVRAELFVINARFEQP